MDFREAIHVMRQHWIVTCAILLLTLVGTMGAALELPWSYKASATVILLDSSASSNASSDGNPYLSFDTSLVQIANILTIELGAPQAAQALQAENDTASYQMQVLSQNQDNEEPFIQVSVSGSNTSTVKNTLSGVTAELSTLLNDLQTKVAPPDRAVLQEISADTQPTRSSSAKVKPVAGVLGVGLVLAFLIPQAIEGVAKRRRRDTTNRQRPRNAAKRNGEMEALQQIEKMEALQRDTRQSADSNPYDQMFPNRHGSYSQQRTAQREGDEFVNHQLDRPRTSHQYGVSGPDGGPYMGTDPRS